MYFSLFPHWVVMEERTVISVTVNRVGLHTTFLILVTCCVTFGTGKLSLTGIYVVSIFLAFKTPQWIRNVDFNLQYYFNGGRKDRESKREDNCTGIYSATITLDSYLTHLRDTLC